MKESKTQMLQETPQQQPQLSELKVNPLHLCADNLISIRHSFSPTGLKNTVERVKPLKNTLQSGIPKSSIQTQRRQSLNPPLQNNHKQIQKDHIPQKEQRRASQTARNPYASTKVVSEQPERRKSHKVSKKVNEEVQTSKNELDIFKQGLELYEEKLMSKFEKFLENFKNVQSPINKGSPRQDEPFQYSEPIQEVDMRQPIQEQQIQIGYFTRENPVIDRSPLLNQEDQRQANDAEEITTFLSPDGEICLTHSDSRGGILSSQQYQSQTIQPSQAQVLYCNSPMRAAVYPTSIPEEDPLRAPIEQKQYISPEAQVAQHNPHDSEIIQLEEVKLDIIQSDKQNNFIDDEDPVVNQLSSQSSQESQEAHSFSPAGSPNKMDESVRNESIFIQVACNKKPDNTSLIEEEKAIMVATSQQESLISHEIHCGTIQNEENQQKGQQQDEVQAVIVLTQQRNQIFKFKDELDLSQLSQEFNYKYQEVSKEEEDDDSIKHYVPLNHSITGHQMYTESQPAKKQRDLTISLHPYFSRRPTKLNNDDLSATTSLFDRNSFQLFTANLVPIYRLETALQTILKQLNKIATKKQKNKPPPSHQLKKGVAKWVDVEKDDKNVTQKIEAVERHMMQGCKQIREMIEYVMRDKKQITNMTQMSNERSYTIGRYLKDKILERPSTLLQSRSMLIERKKDIQNLPPNESVKSIIKTPPEKLISDEEDVLVVSPCQTSNKSSSEKSDAPINRALNFNECDQQLHIVTLKGSNDSSRASTPTKIIPFEKVPEFKELLNHIEEEKANEKIAVRYGIDTSLEYAKQYISSVYQWVNKDPEMQESVIDIVCQAFHKDSKMILAHMQNPDILYGSKMTQDYQLPTFEIPFQPPVFPVELYLTLEKQKHGDPSKSMTTPSASFQLECENIHNKAIFDGLNEALDGLRPYGLRGPPVPWSQSGGRALTFKYGSVDSIGDLLLEAERRVFKWQNVGAGKIPTKRQQLSNVAKIENERIRELRLSKMLVTEIEESDKNWFDFEMEETQIKLDITDMILSQMCNETVKILNELRSTL